MRTASKGVYGYVGNGGFMKGNAIQVDNLMVEVGLDLKAQSRTIRIIPLHPQHLVLLMKKARGVFHGLFCASKVEN